MHLGKTLLFICRKEFQCLLFLFFFLVPSLCGIFFSFLFLVQTFYNPYILFLSLFFLSGLFLY